MGNQTLCLLIILQSHANWPSHYVAFWLSWVVGLISPPSFQWHSPFPFPHFNLLSRSSKSLIYEEKFNICLSTSSALLAMSKLHFSQASVSSKHFAWQKKVNLRKNDSLPQSYRCTYIIPIFSSICVYKYISKYIYRYIYLYLN